MIEKNDVKRDKGGNTGGRTSNNVTKGRFETLLKTGSNPRNAILTKDVKKANGKSKNGKDLDVTLQCAILSRTAIQQELPSETLIYKDLLDELDLDCEKIVEGDKSAIEKAKLWTYDTDSIEELLFSADNRCRAIEQLFGFNKKIVTPNELQYPLAYGAVVYKNLIQVLFMLSAFYRPHNEYCVAVSGSANKIFKFFMAQLGKCFSNIHVMNRPSISWGSFEIINSTWACAELLSRSRTKWMYYQQLAGVDVPLKTNLEMVEILKKWNNTVNSEFATFQPERLGEKQVSFFSDIFRHK
ncbi:hypothetical protein Y032_0045g1142 [Ancylostoma ceylanicum]|uniref:Core-2/I-Branching enzyme n=1 Tax=Ancylostoma ceylanicum TaxID=53326 RepID=A0A016UC38_9BILA|nr:hypothetical protein Y032_0045g1142 [Ancylostoma ceylanicum]